MIDVDVSGYENDFPANLTFRQWVIRLAIIGLQKGKLSVRDADNWLTRELYLDRMAMQAAFTRE